MSGNSAFELINQDGWQAGLKNMLRAEMNRWWKTRTWWIQCLIWIGAVDLILFMVVFASGSGTQLAMPPAELVSLYGVFGGMFTAIGIVIKMQGAIVGEKAEGTAAWVLSKPISRAAFVLSKLMGNAFGIAVTAMLVPGIVAYLVISIGIGEYLPVPDFMAGMGICLLSTGWRLL
jgi:ABC-2 type transport system permease protein